MEDNNGYILLYNSLTGKILRLGNAYKQQMKDILKSNTGDEESALFHEMLNAKIMIPDDFDEMKYIDDLRDNIINKNETLDILIYPTEACNLRCKYCWENFGKGNMDEATETSVIHFLERQIPKYKRLYIKWFGGEPLLNIPAIERIMTKSIDLCRNHGVILASSITTNGYLLTPEVLSNLVKHKIYEYQVTVDGLKKDHDKMRILPNGGGSYDIIVGNLINIKETVTNRLIRILIRTNFNQENLNTIQEYAQFYMQHFGGDKRFSAYWNAVQDWGGEAVHNVEDKLIQNYDKTQINLIAAKYDIPLVIENTLLSPGGYACYAGKQNSFIIGTEGAIYKCPQKIYDDYNKIGHLNKDGDLVLDNEKYMQWVSPFTENKCVSCVMRPSCLSARCPKRKFTGQECKFEAEQLERALITFANSKYNYTEFI